jgi:WD40 repeat protein
MLVWDVERGTSTTISLGDPPQKEYVNAQHHIAPQFTGDGSKLIVRQPGPAKTALIRTWDLKTGRETRQLPEDRGGWTLKTSLLADDKTLIVPGAQAFAIDVTTGQELFAWKAPVRIQSKVFKEEVGGPKANPNPYAGPAWQSFAIAPDGRTAAYIVSADFGNERCPDRIVLCDGKTGKLLHRLDDSGRRTRDLAQLVFSPDGRRLASSDGKVAHLWDVAAGTKLRTLTGHRGDIQALAFSRDGRRLATASADSTVLIWEVP